MCANWKSADAQSAESGSPFVLFWILQKRWLSKYKKHLEFLSVEEKDIRFGLGFLCSSVLFRLGQFHYDRNAQKLGTGHDECIGD